MVFIPFINLLIGVLWLNAFSISPQGLKIETVSAWHQYKQDFCAGHQSIVLEKNESGLNVIDGPDSRTLTFPDFSHHEEIIFSLPYSAYTHSFGERLLRAHMLPINAQAPPLT